MGTAQLGLGVYSFREAARYTRLQPKRVRRWFVPVPSEADRPRLLVPDYDSVDGDHAISFLDMVDVFVFGQLRTRGVSLATLRLVYDRLQQDLGHKHAFAHNRLATDGREVFLKVAGDEGRDELIEVLTRQRVMVEVIQPFLQQLDYDPRSHLARVWRIADGVTLNPVIALGKPVVNQTRITTAVLSAAYQANRSDLEKVAWWFDVSPDDVRRAVEFESGLAV